MKEFISWSFGILLLGFIGLLIYVSPEPEPNLPRKLDWLSQMEVIKPAFACKDIHDGADIMAIEFEKNKNHAAAALLIMQQNRACTELTKGMRVWTSKEPKFISGISASGNTRYDNVGPFTDIRFYNDDRSQIYWTALNLLQ